jgi:hypothetical protein
MFQSPQNNIGFGTNLPDARIHAKTNRKNAGYFESDSLSNFTNILNSYYNGTAGDFDVVSFSGRAVTNPGYGIGGVFYGGYRGITGVAEASTYSSSAIGLYGLAVGTAGNRYGIFGSTSGTATVKVAVYASGDLSYTGNLIGPSDEKFKENISSFGNVLDKIKQLEPKYYSYTKDSKYNHMNLPAGNHYGLVAQELEKVFPELVVNTVHPSQEELQGERGGEEIKYKGILITELIPVLIEGMKEQQKIIEELQRKVDALSK